jgi:hypothetical protein
MVIKNFIFIIIIIIILKITYLEKMEKLFVSNNIIIMQKKEFSDIFYIAKKLNKKKYNDNNKNKEISLEFFSEEINFEKNSMKININCHKKNCRFPYGVCLNKNICKCLDGYASIDNLNDNDKINININSHKTFDNKFYCNYKQKKQLIAFSFEIILSFGLGNFYLHRFYQGFLKLILFLFIIFMLFLINKFEIKSKLFIEENISNKRNLFINISLLLSLISYIVFHIFDIYMLVTNSYLDGNGVEVLSWNKKV